MRSDHDDARVVGSGKNRGGRHGAADGAVRLRSRPRDTGVDAGVTSETQKTRKGGQAPAPACHGPAKLGEMEAPRAEGGWMGRLKHRTAARTRSSGRTSTAPSRLQGGPALKTTDP
ncbi:unnamed protein product [Prorocentrum cordatum]|uniref:Uncharacterized protein n=1 Tax=Prorocentrum cordatum TaxID=2364126 RepID=A0ABN9R670_9DINO|nr:unnamed protein product [Polarella glacialis]